MATKQKQHEVVTLTQGDIERKAAKKAELSKAVIKESFDAVWSTIQEELEKGNTIKLHGKGKFYLSKRSARMGRNPHTGEEHLVPDREAMAFQTSPAYGKRLRASRAKITEVSKPKK